MNRLTLSFSVFAAIAIASPHSSAAPITRPPDLNPGDQYRLTFVTSVARKAASSDITDYNDFVTEAANSVPELYSLSTTWTAIVSTVGVDARDNTGTNPEVAQGVPIYRLGGRVANDYSDLWDGRLILPISVDESGLLSPYQIAWTGTTQSGEAAPFSMPGGSIQPSPMGDRTPMVGSVRDEKRWIDRGAVGVNIREYPIYAMSGVLVAGEITIPEPTTATLLILGVMGSGMRRRYRSTTTGLRCRV